MSVTNIYITNVNGAKSVNNVFPGVNDNITLETSDILTDQEVIDLASITNKVDKITGKGLSTEDYTTAEKSKLAGIQAGAQVNPDLSGYELLTNKTTDITGNESSTTKYPNIKAVIDWFSSSKLFSILGITVASAEINYLTGVTSGVQNQLNSKVNLNTIILEGNGNRVFYDAKGLILSSENCNIQSTASNATITPLVGNDVVRLTALAEGVTFANMVTPYDGKVLFIEIKDNATPQTVAFGSDYEWHITAVTTTTASKWLTIGMIYNGNASKWHILSATTQP